jgi:hypothetical protein
MASSEKAKEIALGALTVLAVFSLLTACELVQPARSPAPTATAIAIPTPTMILPKLLRGRAIQRAQRYHLTTISPDVQRNGALLRVIGRSPGKRTSFVMPMVRAGGQYMGLRGSSTFRMRGHWSFVEDSTGEIGNEQAYRKYALCASR